uniref:NAD-dependent epimerase/dehydratase domain-containing protein n=1 Tax=Quercus lobata TaxID=97700 RepID=A0A7N2LRB5_QUELO
MGSFSVLPQVARRLEGKVALITGGASGIGAFAARLFSKHGAKVIIADMQDELGHSVCKELNLQSTTFVHCDVTKETDMENAVNHVVSTYNKLDIMYNNAGAFLGTKHAARVMISNRKGSIINTASDSSTLAGAAPHAYTSSKHAVDGLTKNTAVELGHFGIRVNCVSPYMVVTPLVTNAFNVEGDAGSKFYSNLKGESLEAEDIAKAALFLASDDSKYVSGHNLFVDGGAKVVNAGFCMYPQ